MLILYFCFVVAAFALTLRRPVWGLACCICVLPYDASIAFAHTTATLPKAVLLSVAAALCMRRTDIRPLLRTPLFYALLALATATLCTMAGALYHGAVMREFAKVLLYLLSFGVAYCCYREDPDRRIVHTAVYAITLIVAVSAIAQEWTGAPSVFLGDHGIVARIAGPLEGPNQLAGFLEIALSWILVQCIMDTERRAFAFVTLAFGYIAVFLTFSRGGIAASFAVACLIVVTMQAWKSKAVVVVTASAAFGLFLDLRLASGAGHLFSVTDTGDTGALGHRSELWRAALYFFTRHPLLGIGSGNYERELGLAGYPKLHDHANSLYLQSLAEGGIVLFAAVMGIFATIAHSFVRHVRSSPLAAGALFASIAFALHQTVDYLVFYPKIAGLWWTLLGVAAAATMTAGIAKK